MPQFELVAADATEDELHPYLYLRRHLDRGRSDIFGFVAESGVFLDGSDQLVASLIGSIYLRRIVSGRFLVCLTFFDQLDNRIFAPANGSG